MGELQQQFTSAVTGFFSSGAVQLGLKLLVAYVALIWLAAAFWAFRDMRARTDNVVLPYLAGALVIFFTPLLFPLGLIVYRIVRPDDRVDERRERELSEALLLSEIGEVEQCVGCHRIVEAEWMVCPTCSTELRERCSRCDHLVEFDWRNCAFCGNDLDRIAERQMPRRGRDEREPVPVMEERAASAGGAGWNGRPQIALAAGGDGDRSRRSRSR